MLNFNRKNIQDFKNQILEDLRELEKMEGVEFSFEGGKFNEGELTLKLKCKLEGVVTQSDKILDHKREVYNLNLNGNNGEVLTGWNPKRPKYPWSYTKNGKNWKCTNDQAQSIFGNGKGLTPLPELNKFFLTGNGD